MPRYFTRCPACGWESPLSDDRYEVDRFMAQHVGATHPNWSSRAKFRRETAE
ncbi:MAG: hypothetical protein ACE5LS_05345 [Thermoplasmata archaeon]